MIVPGTLAEQQAVRDYRVPKLSNKIEWLLIVILHLVITTGLVAIGASSSGAQSPNAKSDETLVKAGFIILLVRWVLISPWIPISFLPSQYNHYVPVFIDGSKVGTPLSDQIP